MFYTQQYKNWFVKLVGKGHKQVHKRKRMNRIIKNYVHGV